MYIPGTCARIANFFVTDPGMSVKLNITCWDSTLFLLKVASLNKYLPNKSSRGANEATGILFDASSINNAINKKNTNPLADSLVGIFRRSSAGSRSFKLSHVATGINAAGNCVGSNNACIGGSPNFNKFNVKTCLEWKQNESPVYNDRHNPNAPTWAKERIVVFRPISQLLR
jgi:hypothetical protein